ncbi:MAG TPA: glycoside hydrolase family 16 protein [Anaerolineae bacterium]|nr:glycoside hydrolase family 16 protein [Anaerolineae bacterium]
MFTESRSPNFLYKFVSPLAFVLGVFLFMFMMMPTPVTVGAPPCGRPNTDPCPETTPTSAPEATPTVAPTATTAPDPTATPTSGGGGGMTLVWSDEFNGSNIDLNNWTYDIGWGTDGWGNNELQSYTNSPDNARIENGVLVIEAREQRVQGQRYTSARLKTEGLHTWTYGRIEARVKVAEGQGLWSAFWMLGNDINQVGWPNSGEIDIMENIGSEPNTNYGTLHGPGYSGAYGVGNHYINDTPLHEDFHVYAVEWDETGMSWYVDGQLFSTVTPNDVPGEWVYDHDFFIIMNLAVGGNWPGSPDATTVFPQQMLVDYVRVYQ